MAKRITSVEEGVVVHNDTTKIVKKRREGRLASQDSRRDPSFKLKAICWCCLTAVQEFVLYLGQDSSDGKTFSSMKMMVKRARRGGQARIGEIIQSGWSVHCIFSCKQYP